MLIRLKLGSFLDPLSCDLIVIEVFQEPPYKCFITASSIFLFYANGTQEGLHRVSLAFTLHFLAAWIQKNFFPHQH